MPKTKDRAFDALPSQKRELMGEEGFASDRYQHFWNLFSDGPQPGRESARENGDRQGNQRFAESMGREYADCIGAEPDRCRVSERYEAAVTDQ